MSKIGILDCTLRDGGYCNQWKFGYKNIVEIVKQLTSANIEVIECGFLSGKVSPDKDITRFSSIEEVEEIIPKEKKESSYVVMMNYGDYEIEQLPDYSGGAVQGIRVAFHKKDYIEAIEACKKLIKKGYKVYVQAMVSLCYSDTEFLELIDRVNEMEPYAFYIVDSFGKMTEKDVVRFFYLLETNLKDSIVIGFHSHNNMQLSFSNAQKLVHLQTKHKLLIDSSVYGMGRGAGNLNTELFVQYLNECFDVDYKIEPLLGIIDGILYDCYQKNPWGYSLPNYLSAVHNAHPNYAEFLDNKKTLKIKDMNAIFGMMQDDKKVCFDKVYIEALYLEYMNRAKVEPFTCSKDSLLKGQGVLLIAPGKSSYLERTQIVAFKKEHDVVTISINFDYPYLETDYIFVSNARRYEELCSKKKKCIITSNIMEDDVYKRISYKELLCDEEVVQDNAGLMAIKYLILNQVDKIYLAGFDGYAHDITENYIADSLEIPTKKWVLDAMNEGMNKVLSHYAKMVNIQWLTKQKFIEIKE